IDRGVVSGGGSLTALPKDDPVITGVAAQYQIGDEINLNCTSAKSFPPSTLHWYINEQQVRNQAELIYFPPIRHRHGLYTAISGLRFHIGARHFLEGSMRVKCVAFVDPVERNDRFNNERSSAVEDLPILQDKREALLLGEWRTLVHVKNLSNEVKWSR
ncbi:uncharacterized protein, partial [Atheta coriaria]|uniref:uncharacterized protein n=1 Tax=Dalotia coriaria TaxID=877792 RepID=UPI0031F3D689